MNVSTSVDKNLLFRSFSYDLPEVQDQLKRISGVKVIEIHLVAYELLKGEIMLMVPHKALAYSARRASPTFLFPQPNVLLPAAQHYMAHPH